MFTDNFINRVVEDVERRCLCTSFDQFMEHHLHQSSMIALRLDSTDANGSHRNWVRAEHVISALYFAHKRGIWK